MDKTAIETALAAGLAASALGAGIGAYTTDTSSDKTPEEKLRHRLRNAGIGLATGGIAGYGLTSAAEAAGLIGGNKQEDPVGFVRGITNSLSGVKPNKQIEKEIAGKPEAEAAAIVKDNKDRQDSAEKWEKRLTWNLPAGVAGGTTANVIGGIYENKILNPLQTLSERIETIVQANTKLPASTPTVVAKPSFSTVEAAHLGIPGTAGSFATKEELVSYLNRNPTISDSEYLRIQGVPHRPGTTDLTDLRNTLVSKIPITDSISAVPASRTSAIGTSHTGLSREELLTRANAGSAGLASKLRSEGQIAKDLGIKSQLGLKLRRSAPRNALTLLATVLSANIPEMLSSDKKP